MSFTPIDEHYEILTAEQRIEKTWIPGYTGAIFKKLNAPVPVMVRQFGFCTNTNVIALLADRGNPNATITLNTLIHGSFNNCYKKDAYTSEVAMTATPADGSSDNGIIPYTIIWEQLHT